MICQWNCDAEIQSIALENLDAWTPTAASWPWTLCIVLRDIHCVCLQVAEEENT